MRKLIALVLLSITITCYLGALKLKGPVLAIGPDEEKAEKNSYYKVHDIFKVKDILIHDEELYILDIANSCVFRFDMKGNLKGKVGSTGAGPSEFYEPNGMVFAGENLWVADFGNNRIQEFYDFKYKRSIILSNPRPYNIAAVGDNVVITSTSIRPFHEELQVFDFSGNKKMTRKLDTRYFKKNQVGLWHMIKLAVLPDGRLLLGYKFLPLVMLFDKSLDNVKAIDLSDYYSKYETREKGGKGAVLPSGYAATAFSGGPDNSILVSVCNNEKRRCNRILQFSSDFSKKIDDIFIEGQIWGLKYFPEKNLLAVINGEREAVFYEVQ